MSWFEEQGDPASGGAEFARTGEDQSLAAQGAAGGPTLAGVGDPMTYFQSLTQGLPGTPQSLIGLEGQLGQAGIKVLRNAAGVAGKIQLPDGRIVDVIRAAGLGGQGWQWLDDGGAGNSPYSMGTFTGGGRYPLASVMGPGFMQPFTAPFNFESGTLPEDPAYKFRLAEGQKAIERSAAAKGTLLTGGTLKDLQGYAQGLASTEYDNAWRRAMEEYQQAYNIYGGNRAAQMGYLGALSAGGQNAAANQGQTGSAYAGNAAYTLGNIGSAYGSGAANQGNIWGNFWNQAGQVGAQIPWWVSRAGGGSSSYAPPAEPPPVTPGFNPAGWTQRPSQSYGPWF